MKKEKGERRPERCQEVRARFGASSEGQRSKMVIAPYDIARQPKYVQFFRLWRKKKLTQNSFGALFLSFSDSQPLGKCYLR
jgi:hypothetical protein